MRWAATMRRARSWKGQWPRPGSWMSPSRSSVQRPPSKGRSRRIRTGATLRFEIADAPEASAWPRRQPPTLRRKPRASIRVAAELVARGDAAALFSAGNTGRDRHGGSRGLRHGAGRRSARRWRRRFPRAARPAVLLDAGANVECRPQHLLQFAVMGAVYARVALGLERPRIGLLSIGEEESKGNELTKEAHRLLKAAPIHFIGNVEGREIYSGVADVVVCDGFTGNIVLKTSEGLVDAVDALLGEELQGTVPGQLGYLLARRAFQRFRRRVDYSEYGGAPLLGVAGLALVGHGRSCATAVRSAIAMAARFAASDFNRRVEQEIAAAVS